MFYGDLHLIDILIFAGIAAFLFFRLGGVLGKKTGFAPWLKTFPKKGGGSLKRSFFVTRKR